MSPPIVIGIVCRVGMSHSDLMSETIQWPDGEFTIQEAVDLNPTLPQSTVRKKLSDAIAAKAVVQTQKGNEKVKGKFKVARPG